MKAPATARLTPIANLLAFAMLVPCTLVVAGAFFPSVPRLGLAGSNLVTRYTPWFVLLPMLSASMSLWLWIRTRRGASLIFAVLAMVVALGAATILGRMLAVCRANGVAVNLLTTFGHRSVNGSGAPDRILPYTNGQTGPLELAIYLPHRWAGDAPVLMYVHGGGWIAGSKLQHSSEMRWFADRGWLVVSVDYALSNAQMHLWDQATGQVGCAMAWVAANAAQYGGDARRFSITGDSSGGNLAINAAYQANRGTLEASCPTVNGGHVPRVAAVIAAYPAIDPASFFANRDVMFGNVVRSMALQYTGGTPDQVPDRYAAIASRTSISPAAPPTLILAGSNDHLVSFLPDLEFTRQARAAGVDVTLIQLPFAEHGFDEMEGSIGNQLFLEAALHFMQGHGQNP